LGKVGKDVSGWERTPFFQGRKPVLLGGVGGKNRKGLFELIETDSIGALLLGFKRLKRRKMK